MGVASNAGGFPPPSTGVSGSPVRYVQATFNWATFSRRIFASDECCEAGVWASASTGQKQKANHLIRLVIMEVSLELFRFRFNHSGTSGTMRGRSGQHFRVFALLDRKFLFFCQHFFTAEM